MLYYYSIKYKGFIMDTFEKDLKKAIQKYTKTEGLINTYLKSIENCVKEKYTLNRYKCNISNDIFYECIITDKKYKYPIVIIFGFFDIDGVICFDGRIEIIKDDLNYNFVEYNHNEYDIGVAVKELYNITQKEDFIKTLEQE